MLYSWNCLNVFFVLLPLIFLINVENYNELDFYTIEIKYPEVKEENPTLTFLVIRNSGMLHLNKDEQKILEASKTGVEYQIDEDLPIEISGFKHYKLRLNSDERITSRHKELASKIIKDMIYIDKTLS